MPTLAKASKLLHGVTFVTKVLAPKIAVEARRVARPVTLMPISKYPAQTFETAGVHRIAFEIEEKIARISQWQLVETKPGLVRHNFEDTQSRFGAPLLQTCLLSQASQSIRRNAPLSFASMEAVETPASTIRRVCFFVMSATRQR
jgi:hypothetical protein